ncbi:hypothetical protein C4D60_Mb05t14410 [Musa balbisiana]|uniref:NAD-dependent epimerase/dehydratase domain-containing protein n=1 Tax=Musa balbisiana TaxID=52838 RepID=A0A4S8JW35_MUSBA|nr:hypothetical protein C4D60_Mb05t14410 [Musa balbisiana]
MAPAFVHRDPKTVCVMDASCRLGASLVEALLRRGYTVHATAYASSHGKLNDLRRLQSGENKQQLRCFRADPFDYQSLVDAMKGCCGLFYVFEPPHDQPYDEYMVEVEVRAAHNVLEACAQTETMERVVFTSSVTAVVWKEDRRSTATLWHALGKTLAEKTAWALAMDRGVEMISVNAALPTGPQLSVTYPYLKGAAEMYEDGVLVTVDVQLLVDAHVAVYESPSAYGRYICFGDAVCRPQDAVKLARMLSPNSSCAPPPPSDELRVIEQRIQTKKLSKLMVSFYAGRHVEENDPSM